MLVLTRKLQETIRIGDNISITVLRTKGKSVRLGIEAPAEVPVVRGELVFDQVAEEGTSEGDVDDAAVAAAVSGTGLSRSESPRTMPSWEPKGRNRLTVDCPAGENPIRVSLQRLPREHVGNAAGSLPSNGGPLRAMLNRRSLTT